MEKEHIYNYIWIQHAKKIVKKIIQKETDYEKLTAEELKTKTRYFRCQYQTTKRLDTLLVDAFAAVREAAFRTTGMKPYPVQIVGGIALHEGKIAQMSTGEGKTLVCTMPAYLNALVGKGVHIVTVNDYLAQRDAEKMGPIFEYLGLSVGVVLSDTSPVMKKEAYACDITYLTNTALGFDYLRDNMATEIEQVVQRGHHYAIIDEVDSILIDEAKTPLIISGEGKDASTYYLACDALAKQMVQGRQSKEFNKMDALVGELPEETGDFIVHEKEKTVTLTEQGVEKVNQRFGIENYRDVHFLSVIQGMDLALRANYIMKKDTDYMVRDGAVCIIDPSTGRVMQGRQYADGLHQAIEAKERVAIQKENQTVAQTTYQDFFNRYTKICGMTGTAYSEKKEFLHTYHVKTVIIPTHKPILRKDHADILYPTKQAKYQGIVEEVKKTYEKGQPILLGTASVKTSEELDALLTKEKIPHQLLNAKQDAKEAEIIAKAGTYKTVTIATNMAGRGTDILLDEKARACGGLKVIGSERHESLRIDEQLRGRSGRQGDVGESIFFLSAEDDLLRLFGSDKFAKMMKKGGFAENESIRSSFLLKAISKAQKKVEGNHFMARKNVLEFDKVYATQRDLIYQQRRKILQKSDVSQEVVYCFQQYCEDVVKENLQHKKNQKEYEALWSAYQQTTASTLSIEQLHTVKKKAVPSFLKQDILHCYKERKKKNGCASQKVERYVLLKAMDVAWMEQLKALDYLKQEIGYVGYAQIDAKSSYALQASQLYHIMKENIYRMTTHAFFHSLFISPNKKVTVKEEKASCVQ